MIKVRIDRNAKGSIVSFTVTGHAGYNDPGKDIVCAGVSAVTVGTLNAIEKLTGLELAGRVEEGFLEAVVPELAPGETAERVQLLLEAMVVMIQSIQESYGAFVTIRDGHTTKSRRR